MIDDDDVALLIVDRRGVGFGWFRVLDSTWNLVFIGELLRCGCLNPDSFGASLFWRRRGGQKNEKALLLSLVLFIKEKQHHVGHRPSHPGRARR